MWANRKTTPRPVSESVNSISSVSRGSGPPASHGRDDIDQPSSRRRASELCSQPFHFRVAGFHLPPQIIDCVNNPICARSHFLQDCTKSYVVDEKPNSKSDLPKIGSDKITVIEHEVTPESFATVQPDRAKWLVARNWRLLVFGFVILRWVAENVFSALLDPAGALGGAGVGKASPNFDLGTVGNIISGLVGGGVLGQIVTLALLGYGSSGVGQFEHW
jgi:hypothetical protein